MLSACCGFFCSLFTPYAHAMGFLARFSRPSPTLWVFPPTFLLTRPVFSPQHIDKLPEWVFSLAFHSLRPRYGFSRLLFCSLAQVFSPQHIDKLPEWVFSLAFLLPRPRYGFSRLLFCSHTQSPLRNISISFRGGFFCLLFTPYAHAMGFLARFSLPSPTIWVFPPTFLLTRPVFVPQHID